jgi:WhiB family redox-sensing transcriptional regulator
MANCCPTLAANYNGNDEFGPSGELLELIANGRPDWMRDGLCRQYAGRVSWFPDLGHSTAMAKAVCARCPVRPECVEYAWSHPHSFGVWGGLLFVDGVASQPGRKPGRPSRRAIQEEFDAVKAEAEALLARDKDVTQNAA